MTRVLLPLALFLALLATPALADNDYPLPPPDQDPDGGAESITVTTPCSTIVIEGTNWSPGTLVSIDREFGPDDDGDDDCDGVEPPEPADIVDQPIPPEVDNIPDNNGGGGAAGASPVSVADGATNIQVAEDGSFSAALVVPADVAAGELAFTASGTGADGAAKQQGYSYQVESLASLQSAEEPSQSSTMANIAMALLAVIIVGLLANQFRLRRAAGRH